MFNLFKANYTLNKINGEYYGAAAVTTSVNVLAISLK